MDNATTEEKQLYAGTTGLTYFYKGELQASGSSFSV